MRRSDLEHTIRAATEIIRADAIIVIGSQAILGSFTEDELPDESIQGPTVRGTRTFCEAASRRYAAR